MVISTKLKERFCKDCNIPIKIYHEPYFMERLELYDKQFGTLEKWNIFVEELNSGKYETEQDYFEEYNRVKEAAIEHIKASEGYSKFINEPGYSFKLGNRNISSRGIYKEENVGKTFISIDMVNANFSAMRCYGESKSNPIFVVNGVNCDTWEKFIGNFTDNEHIINSKYIRQVIMGNCSAPRNIAYEKYIMDGAINKINELKKYYEFKIESFSNDEIVLDVSCMSEREQKYFVFGVASKVRWLTFDTRVELFKLNKIDGCKGYLKKNIMDDSIDVKCVDDLAMPFVLRKLNGQEVTNNDKVFYEQRTGKLASFIEVPNIEV